jgi:hypothetical protein
MANAATAMNDTEAKIESLERAWGITLPQTYRRALNAGDGQTAGECDLLTLDELLGDTERRCGMFPRLLPFAWEDEEHVYAFYSIPWLPERLPVVCWDCERDHCWPVAAGYDAFVARLALEAEWELEGGSDSELAARIAQLDPAASDAQLLLACRALAAGELEAARAHAVRAAAETFWFSDAHYVLGVVAQALDRRSTALNVWWHALQWPIALSTSTDRYDLGIDRPDIEIQEAAIDALIEVWDEAPQVLRESPYGVCVMRPDTFASAVRLTLAQELETEGDADGAERERLNALALATTDRETGEAYDALIAAYDRAGRTWDTERCRLDRELAE